MSREELIKRINAVTKDDRIEAMAAEIRAGQESARTEPLLSNDEVFTWLDQLQDPTANAAWVNEIECRSSEVHEGKAVLHDWDVVREQLRQRLRKP